jgi:hypothetical protein
MLKNKTWFSVWGFELTSFFSVFYEKKTRINNNSRFLLKKILKKMLNLRDDYLHPVGHLHPVYPKLLNIFINV